VAAISGLPVFDINTMISLFMHASRPRIFEQA
jgi:hypothetical protein